jgi:uncharacterized membrane protein
MNYFHEYLTPVVGILIMIIAILLFIFPPEYGNSRFGIVTELTMKNADSWATGQKMFAIAIGLIGAIFFVLGFLKVQDKLPAYVMFIILVLLWRLARWTVSLLLSRKYST